MSGNHFQPIGPNTSSGDRQIVYMDYASTTPVDPIVVDSMVRHLGPSANFGNPSSTTHKFGIDALNAVERAREHVAELIQCNPFEIIWTSGATESTNLALKGVSAANVSNHRRHIVTSKLEHKSVLDTCGFLESSGYEVTYLEPNQDGLIDPQDVEKALRSDTLLVSLMHVNNETGTITDIAHVGEIARKQRIIFHVDASQSLGRLPIDVKKLNADLVSVSGHKIYGPKGIGALYVNKQFNFLIDPQIHGGDQERGLRSGTLATHQIVGMGEAARLLVKERKNDVSSVVKIESNLLAKLKEIPGTSLNGNQSYRVPGIVNVNFAGVSSESLMVSLRDDLAVSSGSACTSNEVSPSHVLLGLNFSKEHANSSIRISIGRFTTKQEGDFAATCLKQSVVSLREISNTWPIYNEVANFN